MTFAVRPHSIAMVQADRLRRVADVVKGGGRPAEVDVLNAIEFLRSLIVDDEEGDRIGMRKAMLRRIWRDHFPGKARTMAARLLAAGWTANSGAGDPLPGTLSEAFGRLDRAGFKPLGWRTIADDLDHALD